METREVEERALTIAREAEGLQVYDRETYTLANDSASASKRG